jgi:hypothetical protein
MVFGLDFLYKLGQLSSSNKNSGKLQAFTSISNAINITKEEEVITFLKVL